MMDCHDSEALEDTIRLEKHIENLHELMSTFSDEIADMAGLAEHYNSSSNLTPTLLRGCSPSHSRGSAGSDSLCYTGESRLPRSPMPSLCRHENASARANGPCSLDSRCYLGCREILSMDQS